MTIQIPPGQSDDAPALSAITHAAKARWGYPREWLAAWNSDLTLTATDILRLTVFVAESVDGVGHPAPVGFAALERRREDWSLEHLWIRPEAEGRGVGRALFTHAAGEVHAQGGTTIRILSDPNASSSPA